VTRLFKQGEYTEQESVPTSDAANFLVEATSMAPAAMGAPTADLIDVSTWLEAGRYIRGRSLNSTSSANGACPMHNHSNTWTAAKTTFENSTGLNKPAPQGKVPFFAIEYRKSTHVEGTLAKIDKLLPENILKGMKESDLNKLATAVTELERHSNDYLRLLDQKIQDETKGIGGKGGSTIYRDLKILRAALQGIVAKIKLDVQKIRGANQSQGHAQQQVFLQIVNVADAMRSAAKDGLLWGQQQLHRPDCAAFNSGIMTKARNITQPLANIRKWAMPDHIKEDGRNSREAALKKAPQLQEQIQELYQQVLTKGLKEDVLALLRVTGTETALDASLEELGQKGVNLPPGSPPEMVIAATKHFMSMAKAVLAIADTMQDIGGARVRIPDVLKPAPEDVPPVYEAPRPPPRAAAVPPVAGAAPRLAPRLVRSTPPNKPLPQFPGDN
jgi:hypothetical protein